MKHYIGPANPMHAQFDALAHYQAQHFAYAFEGGVATLTLNRPELRDRRESRGADGFRRQFLLGRRRA